MNPKGQNIGEYGIAFALIVVISIGVVGAIGENVSRMFSGSISHREQTVSQRITETTGGMGDNGENTQATAPSPATAGPFANLPGKNITVDLGNGKSLALNMADPVAVAEAAGGNGVTENALAVLDQVIAQMKELGEDPAKISELEKLAREGQKIKDIQKQVEARYPREGFANATDKFEFLSNPANAIMIDGKSVSLLEASSLMNLELYKQVHEYKAAGKEMPWYDYEFMARNFDNANRNYFHDFQYASTQLNSDYYNNLYPYMPSTPVGKFMSQLQRVEQLGVLDNPALKNLVKDDLSQQIFNSTNQTFQVPTRADVGTLVQKTRTSANNICSLANGVSCQDRNG